MNHKTTNPPKIAMIGAGSVGFTRRLLHDLLSVPELQQSQFVFMDVSAGNLDKVTRLCARDIEANALPATLTATTDLEEAVTDADYILCTIRQGGLEAFESDIRIPLRYGVDQAVGDTLCAGGIFYAQRTIPALLEICAAIRGAAKPEALLLNYANPMAMNTWACNEYGGVPTIGLCHGVQGAHRQIARCIRNRARRLGWIGEEEDVPPEAVDVVAAGINHQTWFIRVRWRGEDMLPVLLEEFERDPGFSKTEKVRIDVLRRFGYYSTESNGHLSEYLPWYRKRVEEIPDWIDLSGWIHGETGGYLRVSREGRAWFEADFPNWLTEPAPVLPLPQRSREHASYILEALETGRIYRGHFNVINHGEIPNLPHGCVVEIPGYVDANGLQPVRVGPLPLPCAATCAASVRVQEMGKEAAVRGDLHLLRQAMLHDPLVGAVCTPEEVWQMTDEMLVAQAPWLPQYATEIEGARNRLEQHERAGTRVRLFETEGAARRPVRSVEEMARNKAEARKNAGAADKGNLTAA